MQQALDILAVMQQTSGLPNVISYAAISAFEKDQQWRQALGLLTVTQQMAFLPNVISWSASSSANSSLSASSSSEETPRWDTYDQGAELPGESD